MRLSSFFSCLLFLLLAQVAFGLPYSYIDASTSNTTLDGAPLVATGGGANFVNDGTGGASTDNLWTRRTGGSFVSFEEGDVFESDAGSTTGDREATGNLVTSITLPVAGTYEIVAVFAKNSNRDIAARIGAAPTESDIFTASNSLNADQSAASPEIEFDSSYTNGRGANAGAAYLGKVTTTGPSQTLQIFVNGYDSLAGTQDERTQYDGIGYRFFEEPPPPTPKHRDVFILAGQSNNDGRGLKAELTGGLASFAGQQSDVLIHYTNTAYTNSNKSLYRKWVTLEPGFSVAPGYSGSLPSTTFGFEIGAAKVLADHYPNPAFIKVSRGGTALGVPGTDWYPAPLASPDVGPLYEALIESTQLALAELEAAGDTYTVHAIFWHQGESDGGRTAQYGGLLTTLIASVRRDLNMPNLRFVVGELSPTKPQDFRDVQWGVARSVPNVEFLSSRGLVTFEGTHFTTASMATFGQRLGHALLPDRDVLDFEPQSYAIGALDRQDEWAATDGLDSVLEVVATSSQGDYPGGQAAGHVGASGAYHFTRRHMLPLAGARSLQADFFPGDTGYDDEADADSTLLVAGWGTDVGEDGVFSDSEAAIGLGLHQSGTFRIQVGSQTHLATPFTYQTDRWYRLTLNWSEPDASGERSVQLFARDLAAGTDLNGGAAVLSIQVSSSEFDGDPARWLGIGCRTTRGLVDNIRITPPGFAAWAATLYPSMVGGFSDDDDHDGIRNGIEFAFGLNPVVPDSASRVPQPVFGPDAASVSFTPLATQPGLRYLVEWSSNLSTWNEVVGIPTGSLLQFTIPTSGEPSFFIRHRVDLIQ